MNAAQQETPEPFPNGSPGGSPSLRVSIVIPSFNRRAALARCIDSLAGQSYPNYEIIVVDDGSTDDTPQFLEQFAAAHPSLNLRRLRNEPNLGANPSRNRGVRKADGEFVAFVDNDCVARPDWLEKLMRGFTSDRVGAVVGRAQSPKPQNIYELTLKGTQRLPGPGPAPRLVGCNMCVRRNLLIKFMLDEDRSTAATRRDGTIDEAVSGRGDEEGLYLMLRAAGYEQRVVPDAVVLHEHHHTRQSFFKQAFRGGRSAARLVYKYHLPPRLDLLPFIMTYLSLPLMLLNPWIAMVPGFILTGALSAITYNDLVRKGKTVGETLVSFPMLLVYYHVRLTGYVGESFALRMRSNTIQRIRLR